MVRLSGSPVINKRGLEVSLCFQPTSQVLIRQQRRGRSFLALSFSVCKLTFQEAFLVVYLRVFTITDFQI